MAYNWNCSKKTYERTNEAIKAAGVVWGYFVANIKAGSDC